MKQDEKQVLRLDLRTMAKCVMFSMKSWHHGPKPAFPKLWCVHGSPGILLKCRFRFSRCGWGPRVCISNECDAAGPRNTLSGKFLSQRLPNLADRWNRPEILEHIASLPPLRCWFLRPQPYFYKMSKQWPWERLWSIQDHTRESSLLGSGTHLFLTLPVT